MSLAIRHNFQELVPAEHFESYDQMPPALYSLLDELAFKYGKTYDSYLVTEDNRQCFWSPDRKGVLGFIRDRQYIHVIGGLIAKEDHKGELLDHFMAFTNQQGTKVVGFFNLAEKDLPVFRDRGFQISKLGEEPIVDLHKTTWQGKDYDWVRRQENYCRRQGLVFEEVAHLQNRGAFLEVIGTELEEISQRHIEHTAHGYELQFFEGRFRTHDMRKRRVFMARSESRIEGFIVCNPACNGQMWGIDIYRKRIDAPRGVIPFMMLQAMRQMKGEGIEHVSLSLAPCLRCEKKYPGDSALVRRGNVMWFNHLNFLFDMHGVFHYKSRFRPTFRPLFLAAYPKATYFSMDSFLNSWGVGTINPLRLLGNGIKKLAKTRIRKNLAQPRSSTKSN